MKSDSGMVIGITEMLPISCAEITIFPLCSLTNQIYLDDNTKPAFQKLKALISKPHSTPCSATRDLPITVHTDQQTWTGCLLTTTQQAYSICHRVPRRC